MDCSTPVFPVLHHLLEFAQTHVHWVSDALQPSHPLSSPSPPAFNLSHHQDHFQWVSSLHQVVKVLKLQLQHQSFQWIVRVDFLQDWPVRSPCCPRDSQESSPSPQFESIISSVLSLLYGQLSHLYMTTAVRLRGSKESQSLRWTSWGHKPSLQPLRAKVKTMMHPGKTRVYPRSFCNRMQKGTFLGQRIWVVSYQAESVSNAESGGKMWMRTDLPQDNCPCCSTEPKTLSCPPVSHTSTQSPFTLLPKSLPPQSILDPPDKVDHLSITASNFPM